jgi:hypothetical protein
VLVGVLSKHLSISKEALAAIEVYIHTRDFQIIMTSINDFNVLVLGEFRRAEHTVRVV